MFFFVFKMFFAVKYLFKQHVNSPAVHLSEHNCLYPILLPHLQSGYYIVYWNLSRWIYEGFMTSFSKFLVFLMLGCHSDARLLRPLSPCEVDLSISLPIEFLLVSRDVLGLLGSAIEALAFMFSATRNSFLRFFRSEQNSAITNPIKTTNY